MRLLTDQDVYFLTIEWLRTEGHDVITAKQIGMDRASDEEILKKTQDLDRILLTRDKDFGALAFLKFKAAAGILLLRVSPLTLTEVHKELQHLFSEHNEEELKKLFCVVEPHRHRIRYLSIGK